MKLALDKIFVAPLHNMNRDEDGRPKTALFGGVQRGRVSSQAVKRSIRMHPEFPTDRRAIRTRELGVLIHDRLADAGAGTEEQRVLAALAVNFAIGGGVKAPDEKAAAEIINSKELKRIAKQRTDDLGESEEVARREALRRLLRTEQGLVVSTRERAAAEAVAERLRKAGAEGPKQFEDAFTAEIRRLRDQRLLDVTAVDDDISLFGRMVAAAPEFEVEAAVSVSHALTTHEFAVEADYFSAGEELNVLGEKGAAITAYAFHGSGVYYQHFVIDLAHLVNTLGSVDAGRRALRALLRGVLYAMPSGKRNAYAHATPTAYLLASRHVGPTFNLMPAFLNPVRLDGEGDPVAESVARLEDYFGTIVESHGLAVERLAFRGHPSLRQGNAPRPGEAWTVAELEAFVTRRLPEPQARAA